MSASKATRDLVANAVEEVFVDGKVKPAVRALEEHITQIEHDRDRLAADLARVKKADEESQQVFRAIASALGLDSFKLSELAPAVAALRAERGEQRLKAGMLEADCVGYIADRNAARNDLARERERVRRLETALRWIDLRCDHYAPKSPAPYRAPLELIGNRARAALSPSDGDKAGGECGCGDPKCTNVNDGAHHQCGGPREACGIAGCPECGARGKENG